MTVLTGYKGIQVLDPEPTGAGGLAIQNDLKQIVDWQPKSVWAESADPTAGDDENDDFYPGSCWLRTDTTPPKLFVCQSSGVGSAVWSQVLLAIAQDATPKLGGNLDADTKRVTNLAAPTDPQDAATKAYVDTAATALPHKFSAAVGDGASTSIVVEHSLGTRNVIVSVLKSASPYASVICDWEATSVDEITLRFATAPASGQYTVTVIG